MTIDLTSPERLTAYEDFESAASGVLTVLQQSLGFGLWMVTRTEGDAWIVLATADTAYGVAPGDVFRWSDSFCSRMVRGEGPRIAPDSRAVPVYAEAPIGQQVPIGAYVGMPMHLSDGSLFGTLCERRRPSYWPCRTNSRTSPPAGLGSGPRRGRATLSPLWPSRRGHQPRSRRTEGDRRLRRPRRRRCGAEDDRAGSPGHGEGPRHRREGWRG